jgi:predicted nuclease of predicted toxin-antitoxin system
MKPVRQQITEIKLYLDEDVNPQLARDLRNRGYDAVSTNEANNLGLSDLEQLEYARLHERALLTHNRDDFLQIASRYAVDGTSHYGILFIRQIAYGQLLQRMLQFLARQSEAVARDVFLWIP